MNDIKWYYICSTILHISFASLTRLDISIASRDTFSYLYKSHFSFLRRINRKKIYLNLCKKYIRYNIKLVMLFSSLRIMLYDEIENTQSLNYDWGDYVCCTTIGSDVAICYRIKNF